MLADDLLVLAVDMAISASALIGDAVAQTVDTKTTATDMVTEVDRASERLIVDRIRAVRPDDGILGEEGTSDTGTSGVRWIIDPLDGTTNFVYRYPAYSVSIAAEVDGVVVAGAVNDVVHDELFTATLGGGAFLNGSPLHVTGSPTLATALIGTGFSYAPAMRRRQADVLARIIDAVRDVRRGGSAALDLCWVGAGRLDGHYEANLNPWDLAAGSLVAAEAGAAVRDVDGITLAIVAHLADEFVELLRDATR